MIRMASSATIRVTQTQLSTVAIVSLFVCVRVRVQVLEVCEFMSDNTTIPILLDADTGYGSAPDDGRKGKRWRADRHTNAARIELDWLADSVPTSKCCVCSACVCVRVCVCVRLCVCVACVCFCSSTCTTLSL